MSAPFVFQSLFLFLVWLALEWNQDFPDSLGKLLHLLSAYPLMVSPKEVSSLHAFLLLGNLFPCEADSSTVVFLNNTFAAMGTQPPLKLLSL